MLIPITNIQHSRCLPLHTILTLPPFLKRPLLSPIITHSRLKVNLRLHLHLLPQELLQNLIPRLDPALTFLRFFLKVLYHKLDFRVRCQVKIPLKHVQIVD